MTLTRMRRLGLLALSCALLIAFWPAEAYKKKKEDETQTLQVPKDPPSAVAAETKRLVFHVTPLSNKGLLSQQIKDGLKALFRLTGSSTVVKVRAFVAGSGDMRRVRDIVSASFTDHRQNIPALSVIQVGALPLDGAQVVLESIAVAKKDVNGNGLVFISGQGATSNNPSDPVLPLAEKALAAIRIAVKAAGSDAFDVSKVTCFLSSLEQGQQVRQKFAAEYPQAAINYVQVQRAPARAVAECEAVAKLRSKPNGNLSLLNPDGMAKSPNYSQVALVSSPRVVMTSTQTSFGYQDNDAKLAFQRLDKVLEGFGTSLKQAAMVHFYPLSQSLAEQVRKVRVDFYDMSRPPAATMLAFEGLPSMDAGFAVDAVAIPDK
jgi:enamine deaminase RidA (YjgF/YER057c/UK114 family)